MKTLNVLKYIFTIIGAGMLIGSLFAYNKTSKFLNKSIKAQGIVVELLESRSDNSITYKPLVKFSDNKGINFEFSSSSSSNPPSYRVNEEVDVLYDPKSPNNAKINNFFSLWGGITILGSLGLIFLTVGVSIIMRGINKNNMLKDLKLNGKKIETNFQNVNINTSLAVNGRNPFVVVSQWINPETTELHIFTSDNIWFDPTDFIKTDKIDVLIDRKNLKKYSVDLSFLPKVAN